MKITTARRISQTFFLLLFLWFCVVTNLGTELWNLRGWPVNWFLQLDPLVAIGTALSTHTLYRGLLWALATVILTLLLGRFFCGFLCPFGTLHHFLGWLGSRGRSLPERIARNRYRKAQRLKYLFLAAFLVMAALPLFEPVSLQAGLLDPIAFLQRSVNVVLLPILDRLPRALSLQPRHYEGAWVIGMLFMTALFLNFVLPRFYCRFICPLGALLGVLGRHALWRIAKTESACRDCRICEKACEGACEPGGKIRITECVLCFNCLHVCPDGLMTYRTLESETGEITQPDLGRRDFALFMVSGLFAVPLLRLGGKVGPNWHYMVIRPPGSLEETEFLRRCIKCGQCMRVCPTNIVVPGGIEGGIENLWTPVLNFRSGTSGCQLNCTACGYICPTAAIRPISLDEKMGRGPFADRGPIRLGTAFLDRARCLPWAMDRPCIVCQENCPVTPKAIYVEEVFNVVRDGVFDAAGSTGNTLQVLGEAMDPQRYATGDYYCRIGPERYRITANSENTLTIETPSPSPLSAVRGEAVAVEVRLQRPQIDIEKCIGCGTCEHECPVSGRRAIRVSAENESRGPERSLALKRA